MKKLVVARRLSQIFFTCRFIFILWFPAYLFKGPFSAEIFFRADPLIMCITSLSERLLIPGLGIAAVMLLLPLVLGRFFCGWVCPLGACIDAAGMIRRRARIFSDLDNRRIRLPKFLLLGGLILLALFGVQAAWTSDPLVISARFVSLDLIPFLTHAIDRLFIFLIRDLGMEGVLHDFYRAAKSSFLGPKVYYFSHAGAALSVFAFAVGSALLANRLWCRSLCPLGALYALCGRFAALHRDVEPCTRCGACKSPCRMGAITGNLGTIKGECILCMDCVYDCPEYKTRFVWGRGTPAVLPRHADAREGLMSRRQFALLAVSSLLGLRAKPAVPDIIRPPAALKEENFLARCIRCGNCMKACITNGLQPLLLQAGLEGLWTPQLVPEVGYCEYKCTLCGSVCPTGAIPRLASPFKRTVRLGVAEIDRGLCIPWVQKKQCIVCEEHCPVPHKAIKLREERSASGLILQPYISGELCIGCGICQNKCPVQPVRAVRVNPMYADRT